ncbi:MAG: hypothetical protein QM811_13255 [Pirellulales bacterium]
MSEPTPETLAYHEAGHAFAAYRLGGKVRSVTIEPDRDDGPARQGDTQIVWRRTRMSEREFALVTIQVCLSGPVAEMLYDDAPYHPGLVAEWADDWRQAWQAAALVHADERKRLAFLEDASIRLYHRTKQDDHWAALAALADNLLAHETLDAEQVADILSDWGI